ncbi:hypothetical protein [Rubritalea marina]|uniref:hypothetical protein n=1 Tax=Rubritalea marina TaxID=361055 RepID=UPI00037C5731|nr:hypothetical protein [Rubritalea marina]
MSATASKGSKTPAINDNMAGTKAQQYINTLHQELQTATNNYNSQNTILSKYVTQQKDYTTKSANAEALFERLESNLKDAKQAQKDVEKVVTFFSSQQAAVAEMVGHAKDMSTHAYESLCFLVHQGVGRVNASNTVINGDNKKFEDSKHSDTPPPSNVPQPWTNSVTGAIGTAQASGAAAVTAGQDACKAAFQAYISNQSIYSRTTSYLSSFSSFSKQLQSLHNRLVKETSLAKHQAIQLKAQLDMINERVKALNTLVDQKKIAMDEAQNKYNAAQQGASYAG